MILNIGMEDEGYPFHGQTLTFQSKNDFSDFLRKSVKIQRVTTEKKGIHYYMQKFHYHQ